MYGHPYVQLWSEVQMLLVTIIKPSRKRVEVRALIFWTGLLNVSLIYPLQNQFCAKVEEFGGTTGHKITPGNDALQLVLLS